MGIWKTLREKKPEGFADVIILTKGDKLIPAFYNPEDGKFWNNRIGYVCPISNYRRWCYEHELVELSLTDISAVT